jgi:hypothetical protein
MRRRVLLVVHRQTCLAEYVYIGDRCHRPNSGLDDPYTTGRAGTRLLRPLDSPQCSPPCMLKHRSLSHSSTRPQTPGFLTRTFGTKDGGKALARFIEEGGNWRTTTEVISYTLVIPTHFTRQQLSSKRVYVI